MKLLNQLIRFLAIHRVKTKGIKIAIDQSISYHKANGLRALGYEIVCQARDAEPDHSWMRRAYSKGALFVVSPDLDIPNTIEKQNYPMVWIDYLHVPVVGGNRDWVGYVDKRIKAKIKFLTNEFGGQDAQTK